MILLFKEQLLQQVSINKMVVSHFHDKALTEQIIRERIKATSSCCISGGHEFVTGKKAQVANFTGGGSSLLPPIYPLQFPSSESQILEFQMSYVLIQLLGLIQV